MNILAEWLSNPQIWIIAGILLIVVEVLVGGMFALPVGVSALSMAVLMYADEQTLLGESRLLTDWEDILIAFAVLTVVSVGVLRLLFQRKDEGDINKY